MANATNTNTNKAERFQTIVGNKAVVVLHGPGYSHVGLQPINAKTGKPWQAIKYVETIKGENHRAKAMVKWTKVAAELRKAGKA